MTVTLSTKGQLTLPAAARKRLGLRAGSRLEVVVTSTDRLEIVRVGGSLRDLKGLLPKPRRALSLAEIDRAVAEGAQSKPR